MRRFRVVHVAAAAAVLAASVAGIGVIRQVGASGTDTPLALVPIVPCRLADTRGESGVGERRMPVGAAETVRFAVWGTNGGCTIPVTATGIAASVTVVSASSGSYLTVFAADVARPNTSNLNYTPGQGPVSNSVTASLSADGKIDVYNHLGSVDVIIDINGYYVPSASGPAGSTGSTGSTGALSVRVR